MCGLGVGDVEGVPCDAAEEGLGGGEERPDARPGAIGSDDEVEGRGVRGVGEVEGWFGVGGGGRGADRDEFVGPLDRAGQETVVEELAKQGTVDFGTAGGGAGFAGTLFDVAEEALVADVQGFAVVADMFGEFVEKVGGFEAGLPGFGVS